MDATDDEILPRLYQTQLEEIAVKKNTIIFLPTGSGKTHIAISLIKRLRDTLQKPWGFGGKRCFFLVNTVPLVAQQKKTIERSCPVHGVAGFSGEDNVDYWNKAQWDSELSKYQVIVMTCQILSDMLTHQYLQLKDISLLIFDECHHGVEDHPMRLIMKHFLNCPKNEQPRVLGLTATLLNSNVKLNKIQETIRHLETTFQASIATADDMGEVAMYSTNPREQLLYYRRPSATPAASEAVDLLRRLQQIVLQFELPNTVQKHDIELEPHQRDITGDPKKIIKAVKNMIESMILSICDLGVYVGALGLLANIVALERRKRWASSQVEELLYTVTITAAVEARSVLLDSMKNESGYEKIIRHSSEKTVQLLNILKEYNPRPPVRRALKVNQERNALCGLILTQQRFTAKILYNLLKDVAEVNDEEFGFLKHDFIVGFNISPLCSTREQHYNKKISEQALLKFKNGDLNCLIATSVVEEGLDVPQCTLVLRYDVPLEYRSYIQSKGRARNKKANFVILVDEENRQKFNSQYRAFQQVESYLNGMLCGGEVRNTPSEAEVKENLNDDDCIPAYKTRNGNALFAVSAISLLNRYCSVLPHDQYTTILPMVIQEPAQGNKTMVTIIMPIACPIKEPVQGRPMSSVKNAKRSAALNVCIKLHKAGELDYETLLPKVKGLIDFSTTDVSSCFPNWRDETEVSDEGPPGTKKRVRKHPVHYPKCLDGPKTRDELTKCYLHVIKLETAFDEPSDAREKALYDMLRRKEGYGFITFDRLPELCAFPMFLTVGEVRTTLQVNYAAIILDTSHLELIKQFHFFIFDQVLEIAKKFLVHDGRVNNLYAVPLKYDNGYDIDWNVMQTYKQIAPCDEPTAQERASLSVTKEMYDNCVVTPWYRGSLHPDRYIVSRVLEYLTPYSKFEDNSFETFADYYSNKYNLEILGRKDQPLLEVRNISSRMNCLLPRAATIRGLSDKQRRLASLAHGDYKPREFTELFVPEYCVRADYPAHLWYKAIILPSIVHRVTMLLIAEELRVQILTDTQKSQGTLTKGVSWLPIEVDHFVVKRSLLSNLDEPAPINSVDRINNPIDETAQKPPNIVSLKQSVYQLQKKKVSKNYPWDESMEPIDIERNLSRVTVMDIECYDSFVTAPLAAKEPVSLLRNSPKVKTPLSTALLPPPLRYKDTISVLSTASSRRGPEPREVLSALTLIKSNDTFNLERSETLGDSFLKFAASLYLFHKFPQMDEGQLTNLKSRLIGNRNLYYAGERAGLAGRMKVEQFSPRSDFLVPGFLAPSELVSFITRRKIRPTFLIGVQFPVEDALSGNLSPESRSLLQEKLKDSDLAEEEPFGKAQNAMQRYIGAQAVSDKSVADCVEALIGTYLLSGGITDAVSILEWFKIIPSEDKFLSFLTKKVNTVISEGKATVQEVDWLLNSCRSDIETILGYKFKDPSLLLEALSHASYIRNRYTRSYERLEFLGDAILDFLITAYIYENCGDLSPGDLTDLRSALVNNVTFASYVVRLGLHKYFCSQFNGVLENAIKTFVEHQEQLDHVLLEDVLYLIEEEDCNIAQYIDVPKALSDIFESLTGAMFLDSGGDLKLVWKVIYRIMHKEIHDFSMKVPKQPVRVLMEMIHACPSFGKSRATESAVPKILVPVTFTHAGQRQTVYGAGSNKVQAKRAAAKLALKILAT
ncbi:endoribonuclease Dicer isoform X1 [Danaus plexippus]|uniref:endoribonuclease Dicer isoform X1 n=1 Tax=Danaus plexippus TaxID=13037 RepID=UPI002AAFCF21|nr:endoribonuclease Dicer isoform X1 [Danaus plexippus]